MNAITDPEAEKVAWREVLQRDICSRTDFALNRQNVHTPYSLCLEMVDQLERSTVLSDKTFLTFNLEFIEVLCYDCGVKKENIWFLTDCIEKAKVAHRHPRYHGVNVVGADYLTWRPNMKFDVICGNPPYQAPQTLRNDKGISGGGDTLWDKFVIKSFELLKDGGYLCYVHPSGWRDVSGKFDDTKAVLLANTIKYLEMHGASDGQKTFGAATCYDWYVAQKKPVNGELTEIRCGDDKSEKVSLNAVPFVPSGMFEFISKLIAKTPGEACKVLYSRSGYGTDKPNMSVKRKNGFKYPCVYTITSNGDNINLWYSNTNKNGHFDIPKVIFTNGAGSSAIVDATGEFGLCQFSYAIVDSPENLPLIQKAMVSEKFLQVMKACQMQGFNKYSWKVMRCFRKDFWKYFVDENGDELK